MKITLEIPDFDPNTSIRFSWVSGFKIRVEVNEDGSVVFVANKEGLISLAQVMLSMAHPDISSGNHVHLDEISGLLEGTKELIVIRNDDL